MRDESRDFMRRLLHTSSPSGFEHEAARIWREEAEKYADEVTVDSSGTSYARLKGDGPRVMIEGHIDEIGVMISHIDDDGFLWFKAIGGWDDQILTGQRIRIQGTNGPVVGVVGRLPAHQLDADERGKASRIKSLWIDIGAANGDDARSRVSIGDPGVVEQPLIELTDDLLACRGMDNRIGALVALEALRLLSEGERPAADVWVVAPVQEEIGLFGGKTSAYNLDPQVAIAIDVTHATDYPDADVRGQGKIKLGGGPAFARGSAVHPRVYELLVEAARADDMPYHVEIAPAHSGTDADSIARVRAGIPTGIVSIPNRYMHSPNEVVSLADVENCSRVIAGFARLINTEVDFRRM